ncbi:hypothetical protein [Marinomonas sp.]
MDNYFQEGKTKQILARARVVLQGIDKKDSSHFQITRFYLLIIDSMLSNPNKWNEGCKYSIENNNSGFEKSMSGISMNNQVVNIFAPFEYFHTFLTELYTTCGSSIDEEIEKLKSLEDEIYRSLPGNIKHKIESIDRSLPVEILRSVLNNSHIENIRDVASWASTSEDIYARWEKEVKEKEKRVNDLKDALDSYKEGFNFVGLSEGFNKLLQEKKAESRKLVVWVRLSAASMVIPIFAELYWMFELARLNKELIGHGLLTLLPTISLFVVATYFFRVLLANYKGVRSQISQIEIRMTLCRFIQSYAEYSVDLKEKNGSTLERFEEMIFSNIFSSDDSSIPVFDGIEQFSKLVDKIKK